MSWSTVAEEKTTWRASARCCRLRFYERHRQLVVDEYLPYGMRSRSATVLAGSTPTRRSSATSLPVRNQSIN
ncbi:hypothetical protein VPH35_020948 [Triticum aestivum]